MTFHLNKLFVQFYRYISKRMISILAYTLSPGSKHILINDKRTGIHSIHEGR